MFTLAKHDVVVVVLCIFALQLLYNNDNDDDDDDGRLGARGAIIADLAGHYYRGRNRAIIIFVIERFPVLPSLSPLSPQDCRRRAMEGKRQRREPLYRKLTFIMTTSLHFPIVIGVCARSRSN